MLNIDVKVDAPDVVRTNSKNRSIFGCVQKSSGIRAEIGAAKRGTVTTLLHKFRLACRKARWKA